MSECNSFNLRFLLSICGVAAIGGLLFGYDTAVISGAINPITEYFDLSPAGTGWAVSNVAIGCILGALISGQMASRFGRKLTLIIAALLFTVSALGAAVVDSFLWFVIYRMIGGVAVGVASAVSPMYMSEVSPSALRGRTIGMQNFAIVFGQVVIFIINFLIAKGASQAWLVDMGWRVMIGSEVIPCLLFCMVSLLIPESPRWLVMKNRDAEARATLCKIGGHAYADRCIQDIRASLSAERLSRQRATEDHLLRNRRFWIITGIAAGVAVLQQLSGVNIMMYFAPMVLERVTGDNESAMFMTIWIGVVQLIGTGIGAFLMDRVGRVRLLKMGAVGAAVGLSITSYYIYAAKGLSGEAAITAGYLTLSGMLLFMIFFAISWALGAWIVISEVFPNHMRSYGMSMAVTAMWISNFLIGQLFPILLDNAWLQEHFNGAFPMWIFVACMFVAFFFVSRYLPETKGVELENMEEHMLSRVNTPSHQPASKTVSSKKSRSLAAD